MSNSNLLIIFFSASILLILIFYHRYKRRLRKMPKFINDKDFQLPFKKKAHKYRGIVELKNLGGEGHELQSYVESGSEKVFYVLPENPGCAIPRGNSVTLNIMIYDPLIENKPYSFFLEFCDKDLNKYKQKFDIVFLNKEEYSISLNETLRVKIV